MAWWRDLLRAVVREVSADLDVIAPFGYELLRDPAFRRRDPRRLYVYVRVPERAANGLSERVAERLLERLREEAPTLADELRFVVHPGARAELNPGGTRSLRIWRHVGHAPLLEDYARYVIAAPVAVADGRLREVADFATSRSSRRYVLQLSLMLSSLFSPELPQLPASAATELRTLIRELAPVTDADALSPDGTAPSGAEQAALVQIVRPQAEAICRWLDATQRAAPDRMTLEAQDLHGPGRFTLRISRRVLESKQAFVEAAYAEAAGDYVRYPG